MPQDAGGVFEYTDVHCDIGRLIFDGRAEMTFLDIEQLSEFAKSGEPPVALLGNEAMVGISWARVIGSERRDG